MIRDNWVETEAGELVNLDHIQKVYIICPSNPSSSCYQIRGFWANGNGSVVLGVASNFEEATNYMQEIIYS